MKTFKQFQEQINKPSVSLAAKTMGKLGGGIGLLLQTVKGIAQGKHKKRRIFKKEESLSKKNENL